MLQPMPEGIDIQTAQFFVEVKGASSSFRLSWPQDKYYGLARNPVLVEFMDARELVELCRTEAPGFPDSARLEFQVKTFEQCCQRTGERWPSLPVLERSSVGLNFIDGRHRCKALHQLGATRIPVLIIS